MFKNFFFPNKKKKKKKKKKLKLKLKLADENTDTIQHRENLPTNERQESEKENDKREEKDEEPNSRHSPNLVANEESEKERDKREEKKKKRFSIGRVTNLLQRFSPSKNTEKDYEEDGDRDKPTSKKIKRKRHNSVCLGGNTSKKLDEGKKFGKRICSLNLHVHLPSEDTPRSLGSSPLAQRSSMIEINEEHKKIVEENTRKRYYSDNKKTKRMSLTNSLRETIRGGMNSILRFGRGKDHRLRKVLKDLKLSTYIDGFKRMGYQYEDFPNIDEDTLMLLIKDKHPRRRFMKFVAKEFETTKKRKDGWELEEKDLKLEKKPLTRGAYGEIFEGTLSVGVAWIPICAKVIPFDGKSTTARSFVEEIQVNSRLTHDYVLKCFGGFFSSDGSSGTLILEYCRAGDLRDFITRNRVGRMRKLEYFKQIAEGVEYMHSQQLWHGDLKPQNILIQDNDKFIKICDFGTTKMGQRKNWRVDENEFFGTPAYMPPEQYRGKIRDGEEGKMDIYSFGILMWEVWTGRHPYDTLKENHEEFADNVLKFLDHIHGEEKQIRPQTYKCRELRDCPVLIVDLMEMCWSHRVRHRPLNFRQIREEIERVIEDEEQAIKDAAKEKEEKGIKDEENGIKDEEDDFSSDSSDDEIE